MTRRVPVMVSALVLGACSLINSTAEFGDEDAGLIADGGIDSGLPVDGGCPVLCGDMCVDTATDPANCGECGEACPIPENAEALCAMGECGFSCLAGYSRVLGECVALEAPRPIAPLSGAFVTSRRPTLRWELTPRTDGARVELCEDRECAVVIDSIDATGSMVRPPTDLPAGLVFWRLVSLQDGRPGTATSPTWQFRVRSRAADDDVDRSWGSSLDLNGDGLSDVVIAATGAAYVFYGSISGLDTSPDVLRPTGDESLGLAATSAGDLNGDGYTDLVIGAPDSNAMAGALFAYYGGPEGVVTTPQLITGSPDESLGETVAGAADVNGDGYADLVAGGRNTAYLYYGSRDGVGAEREPLVAPDAPSVSGFGYVASAGDANGDGFGDVLVGAPGGPDETTYLFAGGRDGVVLDATIAEPTGVRGRFGEGFANAGDLNGDGFADVVIAAASTNAGDDGVVHVFLGSESGPVSMPISIRGRPSTPEVFGAVLTSLGDIDGDGFADLVVGTTFGDGSVYVHRGFASGVESSASTTLDGPSGQDGRFGAAIASAGDLNGDGFADLVVGARDLDAGAGMAFFYLGSATGLSSTQQVIPRPAGAMQFGQVISN